MSRPPANGGVGAPPREQQDANDYSDMLGYTTVRRKNVTRGRETSHSYSEERRARMRAKFDALMQKFSGEFGTDLAQPMDVAELMYNDPDRADVDAWLDGHGWTASSVTSEAVMRDLDRWVLTEETDEDSFSEFVVAERR